MKPNIKILDNMKLYGYVIVALMGLLACKPIEQTPTTPEENGTAAGLSIDVSLASLDNGEATVNFIPDNDTSLYYFSIISAKEYRENDGDAYVVKRDLAIMKNIAESEKISLSEFLSSSLVKGTVSHTFMNLLGHEEYYVCAYEMDKEGNAGLKVFKYKFKTDERFYESYKWTFEVCNLGKENFDMKVTPETEEFAYMYFFLDDMGFGQIGGENGYEQYISEFLRFYSERYGVGIDEVVSMFAHTGERTFKHLGLLPKTEYYSIVAMVDSDGKIISNICSEKVTTDEVDYLDVSFDVEVSDMGSDYANGTVVPSEKTPYIISIVTDEDYKMFQSDEKLMIAVIESYGIYLPWYVSYAEQNLSIKDLTPESTYHILVFGVDTEKKLYTTKLTDVEFTTTGVDIPEDVTFDISFSEITAFTVKTDYVPSNTNVNYFCDVIEKSLYEGTYGGTPEGLKEYMNDVYESLLAEYPDLTKPEIVEAMQQRGNFSYQFNFLQPDREYYAWAVVIDKNGDFVGEVSMDTFTSLPFEQSDAKVEIVLDKYFDGTELADLDPYKYGQLRGTCVVPVGFELSEGNPVHWYVRAYQGDLTGPDPTDEGLITDLVRNGTQDAEELVYTLPWYTDMTYCAVAVNADGKFGKVTRIMMNYDAEGASPADEFVAPSQVSRSGILRRDSRPCLNYIKQGAVPQQIQVMPELNNIKVLDL